MTTNSLENKTQDRLSEIEKQTAQYGPLMSRLDSAIDKLTEVSTNISNLLHVHGSRLEYQEKNTDKLQDEVDKIKIEHRKDVSDLEIHIDKNEKQIYKELETKEKEIYKEISEQVGKLNEKHGKFEKLIYAFSPVVVIIIWFVDKINLSSIF